MNPVPILFGHSAFKRSTIKAALREAVETIAFMDLGVATIDPLTLTTMQEDDDIDVEIEKHR